MLIKIIKFILIILCMITIFNLSSDNDIESTKKSDTIIIKVFEIFNGKLTNSKKEKIINRYVIIVRKSAHFLIYALLGFLIISFIKEFMVINYKSLFITITIVFLYAISDEIHQLFINGRSCELLDIIIDTLGGFISSFIYLKLRRKKYE